MSLRTAIPWLATAILASIAGMVSGAHARLPEMTLVAASLFCLALVAVGVQINRPLWAGEPDPSADALIHAARRNARLMALGYIWGAAAMLTIYGVSGLRWQHAWQYGLAMSLFAVAILAYVHDLGRPGSGLRTPRALSVALQLTVLQAAAAVLGLGFLLSSGKLAGVKGDWAANQIFLTGGIAIAMLSALAAYTQHRLTRSGLDSPSAPAASAESR